MIMLKKLDGGEFVLNCDMIELIVENPNTTILLTNGRRLIVSKAKEKVVDKVTVFRRRAFGELLDRVKRQYMYQTQKEEKKNVIVMDVTSVLSLVLAVALVIFGMVFDQEAMQMTSSSIRISMDCPNMAITIGGMIGVMMLSFPFKSFKRIGKRLRIIFRPCKYGPRQPIDQIVELAVEIRIKRLLSLGDRLARADEPFLCSGLILAVDSVDSKKVRQMIEAKLKQLGERHAFGRAFHEGTTAYSPVFGMVGTLVSLVLVLDNVSDVDIPVEDVAIALIITLYGSLIISVIYLPIIDRLETRHDEEFLYEQLVVERVLAIQEGENPKFIEGKLSKLLPTMFIRQETDTEAEEKRGPFERNRNYTK